MSQRGAGKPLHFLTIAEAAPLIASGQLSPVALVEAYLERMAAVEPLVSSFVAIRAEGALEDARTHEKEIAAGRYRGPLHGIPYGLKDNIAAMGLPLVANSRLRSAETANSDAGVQRCLAEAGAILLGKLNTYEFGTGNGDNLFELPNRPARNPWDLERFSGGSTTGGGTAIAAGTAMFAIGTDTGGSVRLPAAACGAAGIKPTYGAVSRSGVIPNCYSLDYVGPIAWTAEDLRLILPAIARFDSRDPTSSSHHLAQPSEPTDISGLRVAVIGRFHERDVTADPEIGRGIAATISALASMGAAISDIEFDYSLTEVRACGRIINAAESLSIHEGDYRGRSAQMGKALRDKLAFGDAVPASAYISAQRWRRQIADAVETIFASHDLIICCGTTMTAPRYVDRHQLGAFTTASAMSLFNLTGHPAASICSGLSQRNGMPLNVQLAGRRFADLALLSVAARIETMLETRLRRPDLAGMLPPAPPAWASEVASAVADTEAIRIASMAAVAETVALFPSRLPPEMEPFLIADMKGPANAT